MDEKKIKETVQPAAQPVPQNQIIMDAHTAAERLENANKKQEELIKRQEELHARRVLGGTSEAGITPVKEADPYDDPVTYANALMEGKVTKNPFGNV